MRIFTQNPTPADVERLERELKHAEDAIARQDREIREPAENLGWLRQQYSLLNAKLLPPDKEGSQPKKRPM
jgi:hypothetical protein